MDFLTDIMEATKSVAPMAAAYPKPTPGRVAHIDADFLAYMVSAESQDELDGIKPRRSFDDMQHNAREAVKHLAAMAGATDFRCHITPSASNKGGRYDQAIQQEYQGNRSGREKPEFLDRIRAFIGQELNGVVHLDQEADDGMAQANYMAQGAGGTWGESNLSVIISKDKDLRSVPGLHMDWVTGEHFCTGDPFGSIYIDDTTKTKKLSGWGTKFFWAQLLMGDPADHIKGAPGVTGTVIAEVSPSKAYIDAIKKTGTFKDGRKYTAEEREQQNQQLIDDYLHSIKPCGPALAFEILKDIRTDKDCFNVIRDIFQCLEKQGHEFKHWRTGQKHTATQAMLSDMQLLWMRRYKDPNDVLAWVKEQVT